MNESVGLLDRDALRRLLAELGDRLARRGVRANIYVVGGAAMSLQFDEHRATRDIDSVVLTGHGPLMDEVRAMARLHNLPGTWLNEQASSYVSRVHDGSSSIIFDHPNLSVAAASAKHLLAMKVLASRASDVTDLRLLLSILNVTNVTEVQAILVQVFPDRSLSDRARLIIEDLLAAPGDHRI
jgi:Nucleotidyltransferase of unknown function (DUF6036)